MAYPNFNQMTDDEFRQWAYRQYTPENTQSILDQIPQKKTFGDYAKGFNSMLASSNAGVIGGNILSGLGSAVGNKYNDTQTDTQKSTQSAILGAVGMIPGYGQIIAAGLGGLNAIGEMTGLSTSNVNKESAKRFDKGLGTSAAIQNTLGYIPGASAIAGGIGSALFGGGRTDSFNASDDALSMESGYSGSVADLMAAEDLSEKKWFSRKAKNKANAALESARQTNQILTQIGRTNTQRKQSDYYQDLQNQNINRYSGENYLGMRVGKNGLKLMTAEEARRIIALRKESIEKFQNGGTITATEEQSIIPEGKLHKELHHLDKVDPEAAEEITRKGIPVVSVDENGTINQTAEVERDEWTLSKSLTDQIETLYKQWLENPSEDLELQCGKLAAEELQNNTVNLSENLKQEENGE